MPIIGHSVEQLEDVERSRGFHMEGASFMPRACDFYMRAFRRGA